MSRRERELREGALSDEELGAEAEEQATNISEEEEVEVEERRAPPAKVVHEVIRRQGIEELERPAASLLWSGLVAGVAIGMSILAEAILKVRLPESPVKEFLVGIGYTVGFVIVILGRLQLFTESTITAVLPLATKPSWASLGRTARLWVLVLAANMAGTFAFALFAHIGGFGGAEMQQAIVEVSKVILEHDAWATFLTGIPSGFLLAVIVWLMPSSSGQRVWIIMLLTGLIVWGGFAHVVAGSCEAWVLVIAGTVSLPWAIGSFLFPALIGNVVGGTALFTFLAHAQVHREIHR